LRPRPHPRLPDPRAQGRPPARARPGRRQLGRPEMTADKDNSQQPFRTSTMDADQTSFAGFVDGEHWATLIACFEQWPQRHGGPHAVITARRMAKTANDIPNDLIMAMFEIVEAEYDEQFDRDGHSCAENTHVWRAFDAMCERFAAGYQPKDATEF